MPIINETILSGVNAKDATATSADILQGKTAVVGKELITGIMKNNSGKLITGTFDSGGSNFIKSKVPEDGYYDTSSILQVPVANLVSGNIRSGVNIGGVVGNYSASVISRPVSVGSGKVFRFGKGTIYTGRNSSVNYPYTVSTSYNLALAHSGSGREICVAYFNGISLVTSFRITWDYQYLGTAYSSTAVTKNSDGSYTIQSTYGTVTFTRNSSSEITFISSTSTSLELDVASF